MIGFSILIWFFVLFFNKHPYTNKHPYSVRSTCALSSNTVHISLIAYFKTQTSFWLMSVHNSFKGMISSSIFATIAWLVVMSRKDPGTTSLFSSLLDPFQIYIKTFFAHSAVSEEVPFL